MIKRVTPSQYRNMVRQAQQKQKQAIDKYNREVNAYNRKVHQEIDKANREIRAHNRKVEQDVNRYNREVRAHNARVRADRQRLKTELARLSRQGATTRHVTYRVSVDAVQTAYERLELSADTGLLDDRYNEVLDLSEREAANNAQLMNALAGDLRPDAESSTEADAQESPLTPVLLSISKDLTMRWQGALHALSPRNPDAARHFCTSARELITGIFEAKAPDGDVVAALPDCELTPEKKTPTRRAKIQYFLHMKGMDSEELVAFADADIENIIALFKLFNKATHGDAGAFSLAELRAIRQRVEDGIMFLSRLIA